MAKGVELTVSRQALERTLKLKISIHLCRGCSFAKEPQGLERLAGMAEETRHRFIGDIHAGAAPQKTTVSFRPPVLAPAGQYGASFSYARKNCGKVQTTPDFILRSSPPAMQQ